MTTRSQPYPSAWGGLVRFAAGVVASAPAGWLLLPGTFFDDSDRLWLCVVTSTLVAGVLSLVRVGRMGGALTVVMGFALLQLGQSWSAGVVAACVMLIWSLFLGGGVFLSALIFHRLAEMGYAVGKFLLLGPLVGGVYLATTPLAGLSGMLELDVVTSMWLFTYLGIVIGDAVGFGVEMVDLIDSRGQTQTGDRVSGDGGAHPRPGVEGSS
ncbi:MAG: hypothetical protein R3344_09125 [Acidobacteriota bacterium]|nr:hypothetical protein [Acidobacteriota bacterium]